MKTTAYAIDGQQIEFAVPKIKTQFWISEDARTAEEWHDVQALAAERESSAEYFISENLRDSTAARYLRCLDSSRYEFWTVQGRGFIDVEYKYEKPSFPGSAPLSEDGRRQLRAACESEQAKFARRLRTYLKRYGLARVSVDTYWSMA